ncbi:hypothetical protein SAMN04488577_1875 [Bacillus sp. cl95]|nr:hypothetical protein SAMN02799634_103244 [Bacillus sp. UNCCL13]SFQ80417.1 hypothetical protein SAMN04488577_1875 [Bacillus sp. cl95]
MFRNRKAREAFLIRLNARCLKVTASLLCLYVYSQLPTYPFKYKILSFSLRISNFYAINVELWKLLKNNKESFEIKTLKYFIIILSP